MRKRVPIAVGGVIALVVASQYMDFGLGFTDGDGNLDGPGTPAEQAEMAAIEDAIAEVDSPLPMSPEELATDPAASELTPTPPILPPVVDVLIDGNQYWVAINANDLNQREPKTLDEILAMASTLQGEPDGVRIRVTRTPDAVASAEAAMMSRLNEAGLTADEIDARRQLVDRD